MAALAYCVETAQQGDLSKAKIVSIFRNRSTAMTSTPVKNSVDGWYDYEALGRRETMLSATSMPSNW